MKLKFYRCSHCGKIIVVVKESGVPVMCCGQKMEEINPGTTDAAVEKHVPVYSVEGGSVKVCVGVVSHPMTAVDYIVFIAVETIGGYQIKYLTPEDEPKACFALADGDEVEAVYAYCNLHSLWKA